MNVEDNRWYEKPATEFDEDTFAATSVEDFTNICLESEFCLFSTLFRVKNHLSLSVVLCSNDSCSYNEVVELNNLSHCKNIYVQEQSSYLSTVKVIWEHFCYTKLSKLSHRQNKTKLRYECLNHWGNDIHISWTHKLHTFHRLITESPVTWTPPWAFIRAHWITSEDLFWSRKHGLTCTVYLPHTSISSEPRISERTSTRGAADNLWRTVQKFVFKLTASETTQTRNTQNTQWRRNSDQNTKSLTFILSVVFERVSDGNA